MSFFGACGGKTRDVCTEYIAYMKELHCDYRRFIAPSEDSCRTDPRGQCLAKCFVDIQPTCNELNSAGLDPNASPRAGQFIACQYNCRLVDAATF